MYSYNIMEWLLFFYIYCFLGWIWETLYVSVLKAKWVNRGFLHGPFLPIYGSGATIMLFLTIPTKHDIILTYIIGALGATALEFVTGAAMEKMFGVRYWDYSDCFLNVKGHICLKATLLWGAFSVLLINVIHHPIEHFVTNLSFNVLQIISLLFTAYFAADFSASFREALDLKEVLMNLTESNEEFRKIEKRIEVVATLVGTEVKEKSTEGLKILNKTLEDNKQKLETYKEAVNEKRKSPTFITKRIVLKNLAKSDGKKNEAVNTMSERIGIYLERLRTMAEKKESTESGRIMKELETFRETLEHQKRKMSSGSIRTYMRITRLLRRNPDAVSDEYKEALDELMKLDDLEEFENASKKIEKE